LELTDIISASS